jgi:diketogulonate reductase-like aldo/keto reductase
LDRFDLMDDHTLDAEAGEFRRVEVIADTGRRRYWPVEVKARIVAEADAQISDVARRRGIRPQQLSGGARCGAAGGNAEIALAWVLAQKPWIVPIPGTRRVERLDENLGAISVGLSVDDLREIDGAASGIEVQGARYPEDLMKLSGR